MLSVNVSQCQSMSVNVSRCQSYKNKNIWESPRGEFVGVDNMGVVIGVNFGIYQ